MRNFSLLESVFDHSVSIGGSSSPFIDEGDGFTGDGERVRHADEDRIMVGPHNAVDVTVECEVHVGGGAVFFRKGRRQYQ